jgi:hypothetical protein
MSALFKTRTRFSSSILILLFIYFLNLPLFAKH